MLSLALIVALATPSGPIPRVLVRAADCEGTTQVEAGKSLRFTHETYSQTCAPGGPCSLLGRAPRPVDGFEVRLRGCDRPVKGRIVKTGQTCDALPVWRFTGSLAAGHRYDIGPAEHQMGIVEVVGGKPRPQRCGSKWIPAVRNESRPLTRPPEAVVVAAEMLDLKPTEDGEGSLMSWSGPEDLPLSPPAQRFAPAQPVDTVLAGALTTDGGYRGTVTVQGSIFQSEKTTREGTTCQRIVRGRVVLKIEGTDVWLGGDHRTDETTPGACPPLPDPPPPDPSPAGRDR